MHDTPFVSLRQACVNRRARAAGQRVTTPAPDPHRQMTAASRLRGDCEGRAELPNGIAVGPRQPCAGCGVERVEMPLEDGQIVEGLDPIELARVDEGHEQIPDLSAVWRLIKQ